MTRRIRLAIVLTAWAILALGGIGGYLVFRQVLLAELDDALAARAAVLPDLLGVGREEDGAAREPGQISLPPEDRFVIKDEKGRTLASLVRNPTESKTPIILGAAFVRLPDGSRLRRVTVGGTALDPATDLLVPVTIIYSGNARWFDDALSRVAVVLLVTGLICAVASAWVARYVTAAVLRPLNETAEVVGTIDERNLKRRIQETALPPELVPMARRLNEMLSRLDHRLAQRKQFLADAAHELRTPVAALLTSLEVSMMRPREPQAMRQTMQDCLTDVRSLRQLVERLLEHARADGGARAERPEPIDISRLLDECVRTAEGLGRPRGVTILRRWDPLLTATLPPNRFRSVVMNLLGNAVEYNRPDGTVEVRCVHRDEDLELIIRDTGPGIAPEHVPHIFEPFYRGDRARLREGGHSGLGLFLVRSHMEAMGGRCEISSELGVGTTFRVIVPRTPEEAFRHESVPAPAPTHDDLNARPAASAANASERAEAFRPQTS